MRDYKHPLLWHSSARRVGGLHRRLHLLANRDGQWFFYSHSSRWLGHGKPDSLRLGPGDAKQPRLYQNSQHHLGDFQHRDAEDPGEKVWREPSWNFEKPTGSPTGRLFGTAPTVSDQELHTAGDEVLRTDQAHRMLGELMEALNDEMGNRDNLAEAVSTVLPLDPTVRIIPHAFDKDFAVAEMMVEHAERYLCEKIPAAPGTPVPQPTDYGIHWGALFPMARLIGSGKAHVPCGQACARPVSASPSFRRRHVRRVCGQICANDLSDPVCQVKIQSLSKRAV